MYSLLESHNGLQHNYTIITITEFLKQQMRFSFFYYKRLSQYCKQNVYCYNYIIFSFSKKVYM